MDDDEEKMDEADENDINKNLDKNETPSTTTEYLVSAVIKKKFLFNKRPRPIVYLEPKQI